MSWIRGNLALLLSMRGDATAAVALAQRNCELTERLGDVFSRTVALANLASVQLVADEYTEALASIEESERTYRGAMGQGGEQQAWRAAVRANALTGVGRADEAVELAQWASGIARERGILWTLPLALRALAGARMAAGQEGAREALDEAAEVARRIGGLQILESIEETRDELATGTR